MQNKLIETHNYDSLDVFTDELLLGYRYAIGNLSFSHNKKAHKGT